MTPSVQQKYDSGVSHAGDVFFVVAPLHITIELELEQLMECPSQSAFVK